MNTPSTGHEPARSQATTRPHAWLVLLGGGIAWTLHLLFAYAISEFGCLSGLGEEHMAGISIVAWLLLGLSMAALALAGLSTFAALRMCRRVRDLQDGETVRAFTFSARLALVTNVLFTLVIAVQTVPVLYYLGRC